MNMAEVAGVTILPPTCPLCGRPPASQVTRTVRNVFLGDYMCAEGHLWILKTLVVQ